MLIQDLAPGPFSIPQTAPIPQLQQIAAQLAGLQSAYAPQQAVNPQSATFNDHLRKVKGIESMKQFPMQPNSRDMAFDMDDNIFYVATTDASNFRTIERFRFERIEDEVPAAPQYVTMEEFNKFKEDILNGKHAVRSGADNSSNKQSRNWNNGSSGAGKQANDNAPRNAQSSGGDQ